MELLRYINNTKILSVATIHELRIVIELENDEDIYNVIRDMKAAGIYVDDDMQTELLKAYSYNDDVIACVVIECSATEGGILRLFYGHKDWYKKEGRTIVKYGDIEIY